MSWNYFSRRLSIAQAQKRNSEYKMIKMLRLMFIVFSLSSPNGGSVGQQSSAVLSFPQRRFVNYSSASKEFSGETKLLTAYRSGFSPRLSQADGVETEPVSINKSLRFPLLAPSVGRSFWRSFQTFSFLVCHLTHSDVPPKKKRSRQKKVISEKGSSR